MDINNFKKVCVVGWARSGIALCDLLLKLKKEVLISEIKERGEFDAGSIDAMRHKGVKFEFGGHSDKFIKDSQMVVISPGVDPNNSRALEIARQCNIPYLGEMEFSFCLTKARCIGITGTNGKTTTTYLTYKILQKKRKRVFLGGNIGTPFSSLVLDTKEDDIVVIEVSSFQLETIISFRPFVAALLNLEPDHLDRYTDFKNYVEAKTNIFRNQRQDDYAILNKNIELRSSIESKIRSKLVHFSDEFPNENLSCVYRIANIFGMSKVDCMNIFSSFEGLDHRLQVVRKIKGITFINDSKATNPSSTVWALKNVKAPVILLVGGKDKGLDYSLVNPYLRRVKKVHLFGEASFKIRDSLAPEVKAESFSSLAEATKASLEAADSGDTVLLSPMCASFDEFANYEERGKVFIEIVKNFSA